MNKDKKESWEERFDKKINTYDKVGGFIVYVEDYDNEGFDTDLIKSFISEEIAKERERLAGEVKELPFIYYTSPKFSGEKEALDKSVILKLLEGDKNNNLLSDKIIEK